MSNDTNEITARVGEVFSIEVESNPTTGYMWEPRFDDNILKLVSSKFIPMSKQMGSGGLQRFDFKASKPGRTIVKFIYKRTWEERSLKEKEFSISIK
jgi:inhibitor of cysteine peptidase